MRLIAILLCGALAGCSQTGAETGPASKSMTRNPAQPGARHASAQTRCSEAVAKVQQQSTNAAMLGSALSMAGGFGGFAGRGGAVAAQAVSVGGSMIQAKAQNDAQSAVEKECRS